MKYKVGDKVRIIGNHMDNGKEYYNQSMVGKTGTISEVAESSDFPYCVRCGSDSDVFLESDLEPIEEPKTFDNLQPGDELYNDGNRITVVVRVPAYTVRYEGGHESEKTVKELEKLGYVLAQDTIEIAGKTYKKQAVMQALSSIEEIK
jgi:hypothetical protein